MVLRALLSRRATFTAVAASLLLLLREPVAADQVLVASLVDDIVYADLVGDGNCVEGCSREEHAVAFVAGVPAIPSCQLQTTTPFSTEVPQPGLLQANIYCEDSTGALIEQYKGPCNFEVCVDFDWTEGLDGEDGTLTYDVVITRDKKPRGPHTVYVDLSVTIDPTATDVNVDSCSKNGTCAGLACPADAPFRAVA